MRVLWTHRLLHLPVCITSSPLGHCVIAFPLRGGKGSTIHYISMGLYLLFCFASTEALLSSFYHPFGLSGVPTTLSLPLSLSPSSSLFFLWYSQLSFLMLPLLTTLHFQTMSESKYPFHSPHPHARHWWLNDSLLQDPQVLMEIGNDLLEYFSSMPDCDPFMVWKAHKCYIWGTFIKLGLLKGIVTLR